MPSLHVNGQVRTHDAEPDTPLLWVLREQLGLTGTKYGCGVAQCGACTVHIDGVATRSCVRPVSSVDTNAKITTRSSSAAGRNQRRRVARSAAAVACIRLRARLIIIVVIRACHPGASIIPAPGWQMC